MSYEQEIINYKEALCPFKYLDIKHAISTAYAVGEDEDWAVQCVQDCAKEMGMSLEELDPVGCVYDMIIQEARADIEGLTGIHILNDCEGNIGVFYNFLDTRFDYDEEFQEWLIEALDGKDEVLEFNKFTLFLIGELNIDVNELKPSNDEE